MTRACAITGHRPTRFKFKYNEDYSLCKKIKRTMMEQFKRLHDEEKILRFYVGGALGVDMWAGEIILRLKETPGYEDIELVVVLPFRGHDRNWDVRSRKRLEFLIKHSVESIIAGERDCRGSYIQRNCYMVDHAEYLLAIYDNNQNLQSGTMQMVRYAKKKSIPMIFIDPDTAVVTRE